LSVLVSYRRLAALPERIDSSSTTTSRGPADAVPGIGIRISRRIVYTGPRMTIAQAIEDGLRFLASRQLPSGQFLFELTYHDQEVRALDERLNTKRLHGHDVYRRVRLRLCCAMRICG